MAGERFGRQVRDVLELLLAAPRRPPHALAEPHERIDDERRGHEHDEREPPVEIEQQRGVARRPPATRATRSASVSDTACLHLVDVVRDARDQLTRRAPREERRGLIEDVAGTARCADRARRAGRRRPSGSWRRSRRCPSGSTRARICSRDPAAIARAVDANSRASKIGLDAARCRGTPSRPRRRPSRRARRSAGPIRPGVAKQTR